MIKTSDFDFILPENLIASNPLQDRDASKMLVVPGLQDKSIKDFIDFIKDGDVIVFNNSKVIPARFNAKFKDSNFEITLHTSISKNIWLGLCKKFNKLNISDILILEDGTKIEILDILQESGLKIKFICDDTLKVLDKVGKMPLPPYIKRTATELDNKRYQTVYAEKLGSMAAPTAGLHFTETLLRQIKEKGAKIVNITLHVGSGTWMPVKTDDITKHKMHSEFGEITEEQAKIINSAKRVIAIGTTSLRLLESSAKSYKKIEAFNGTTNIFIYPGYKFKIVDVLLTNFHLPKSTLFMLVSAFSGLETMKQAYQHAIDNNYRFFSYGDCCLLFKKDI